MFIKINHQNIKIILKNKNSNRAFFLNAYFPNLRFQKINAFKNFI